MEEPTRSTRGIRGAITVEDSVEEATAELLDALAGANGCRPQDVAAAIFTLTEDLADANPAAVARGRGWASVPLLMVREHGGDTGVPRCLRVLLLWNTDKPQEGIRHLYLRGAAALRPDLDAETHVGGKP
jgi:chorismate mutase